MEEIGNTEAIQKEILEEARKTAERLIHEAEEEVARTAAEAIERSRVSRAEVSAAADAWIKRYRLETLARLPLDKIRYKTDLIDRRIRNAMKSFVASLGEERIAALSESLMRVAASQFAGLELTLRYKGIGRPRAVAAVKTALGVGEPRSAVEDSRLPAPGIVVESVDGSLTLKATLDLVESDLLDRQRGELAKALCAEALKA